MAFVPDLALLTRRTAAGDHDAYRTLFHLLAPRVLSFLSGRLARTAAEEATQEVMVRVWLNAGRYDGQRASVATWVFTIARNVAVDRLRTMHHAIDLSDPTWVPERADGAEGALDAQRDATAVRLALSDLPAEQADVVTQVFYGGSTLGEVAARAGIALGTVKSRLRLALASLRGSSSLVDVAQHPPPEGAGRVRSDRVQVPGGQAAGPQGGFSYAPPARHVRRDRNRDDATDVRHRLEPGAERRASGERAPAQAVDVHDRVEQQRV